MNTAIPTASTSDEREEHEAILNKLLHGKPIPPEVAQRIRERADRIREGVFRQHGLLDIGVPAIRAVRAV